MKIDKKKPEHWWFLLKFGLYSLVGLVLRVFVNKKNKVVFLYGHKLNGNLSALYDYHTKNGSSEIDLYFLTMDPAYWSELEGRGVNVELVSRPSFITKLAHCSCVISDHGLHSFVIALWLSDIKFVDVWHGIPFKGFDREDFKVQRKYNEVWVPSEFIKDLYVTKFDFDPSIVFATGYARTDALVGENPANENLKQKFGISPGCKVVLFAPTWQQDVKSRSIYPFAQTEQGFLDFLDKIAALENCVFLIRTHLNCESLSGFKSKNIILVPSNEYPNTEAILLISDVLICDWSSIAFDYLLLNRPTLFLDVPAPFEKGFSLDASFRYGVIIKDIEGLRTAICQSLEEAGLIGGGEGASYEIKSRLYEQYADGKSSERCYNRLQALMSV